jgi:hypothetical protein
MLFIVCILTTAIVSVWGTAVANVAIKNQLMQRQLRQLQYWQSRAMQAENASWRR